MAYTKYILKINPVDHADIYRVIEINGTRTLDHLSNMILDAFDFDKSHLYMFSMSRKYYDSEGYYHPAADGKKSADKVKLRDLDLKLRNKILYLYDFGDEWSFYITVKKIVEVEYDFLPRVIERQGNLAQYPDWELEEEEEEEEDDEFEGEEEAGGLVVGFVDVDDEIVYEKLKELTGNLQVLWMRLVKHDLSMVGDIEITGMHNLEEVGLLEMEASETQLSLRVLRCKTAVFPTEFLSNLAEQYQVEIKLYTLGIYYGVMEIDELLKMANLSAEYRSIVEKICRWHDWNIYITEDQCCYVSVFNDKITEDILAARKHYPVKHYKKFTASEKEHMDAGDWQTITPIFGETFEYFAYECGWSSDDTEHFLNIAIGCIGMDFGEAEFVSWTEAGGFGRDIRITQKMRKVLQKFWQNYPSAALKGYTRNEYENGYQQLFVWDDK